VIWRQYDPINGVWMRLVPNLGMSFAELEAEMDRMVVERLMRGPLLEEMVRERLVRTGVLSR
jgi:hypothetical protein